MWVLLAALAAAVIAAWQYSAYKDRERARAESARAVAAQRAEVERVAKERKELEERQARERKAVEDRQAQEKEQKDALASSLKDVDSMVRRWDDAVKLAGTTGRINLSGPVSTLQAVKRDAEQLVVPPCLDTGKAELVKSMSQTIEGFLVFMRNELKLGETLAQIHFDEAKTAMSAFQRARASCPA